MKSEQASKPHDLAQPSKNGLLALGTGKYLLLEVCKSQAGYYVGTLSSGGEPYTRESQEYWPKQAQADVALRDGTWTQKSSL